MEDTTKTRPPLAIAQVERETGLSKDILRVWEKRYGYPQPERDGHGERAYPAAQVDKLRLVKRLLDQGLRPGKVIGACTEELEAMLTASEPPVPSCPSTAERCAGLVELLRLKRCEALRRTLQQALLKQGLQSFVTDTIAPMNRLVGNAWLRGDIDVPEEHLYTEQVQNILRSAISTHASGGTRPRVLLTTFPEESHVLGLLMAEAMLVSEGATCVSLGTRVPLGDIEHAALSGEFDVLALSFSAAYPVRQALEGLATLRAALPGGIAIWAGGQALAGRPCTIEGVTTIEHIDQTLALLQVWRARNGD